MLNKPTILIIEDEDFLSRAYKYILEKAGFEVWQAADGLSATSMLGLKPVDCVILDIMLPGKDGFEILREMKADERWQKVPVIILSNLSRPEDIEKGKTLGAAEFLVKANIDVEGILQSVNYHLKKHG